MIALVAFVACSPSPTPKALGAIKPLSEILVREPEFTDVQADSATVRIETRIPVACAAAYGTTTAYGQIATDTDMAGGGHREHHPVLTGLKPDTVYQVRLQGVGPDGTLYVSDNLTFRTPSTSANRQPAKPQGKNVALLSAGARIKAVSSNYGGGDANSTYGANKAIDGDLNTEWSSNGDGDRAWIEIDLGKEYPLSSIGFRTRTMGTSAQIERLQVITDKGENLGPFDLPDAKSVYYFPVAATARTLRFQVIKSSGGNTGAAAIEVYAPE
ncbi:MAG: hypothetical protein A2Z03_11735 [Chloroflexi bacterium RBG_16_56_8]|nr:MAG: hypothetical protein A2Z03_11735 [Chloroflexi bacterium RBG_16_56_8]